MLLVSSIQISMFGHQLQTSVSDRADCLHLNSADSISITIVGNLDVTIVSPGDVPGVLDQVVVLAVFRAIANGEDTVVEVGATLLGLDDSTGVEAEGQGAGLDGD